MQLPEIKLIIKEVEEKTKSLTKEEQIILLIAEKHVCIQKNHPSVIYAKENGYVFGSYLSPSVGNAFSKYGSAKFRIETTRNATPKEESAYYYLKVCEYCKPCKKDCWLCGTSPCPSISGKDIKAKEILKGKEITIK